MVLMSATGVAKRVAEAVEAIAEEWTWIKLVAELRRNTGPNVSRSQHLSWIPASFTTSEKRASTIRIHVRKREVFSQWLK